MVSALIRAVLSRTRERLHHSNMDTQDPAARSPGPVPFGRYLPPEARVLRPRAHDRTTSNGPIHLPLIDGHIVFRELLALRLAQEPDFLVIAEAGSLAEIRQVLSRVEVDVALVELALADGGGVELIRDLRADHREARVLVLTASEDRHEHAATFAAGAAGVLRKWFCGRYYRRHPPGVCGRCSPLIPRGRWESTPGRRSLCWSPTTAELGSAATAPRRWCVPE
jgi:CheY-like chemotaxis protein